MIDGIAVLLWRGQGGRCEAQNVALRIDRTCADAAGSDIAAEEKTCHWNSLMRSLAVALASRKLSPRAIALQHKEGLDGPHRLCNFLQRVKKFASGLFARGCTFRQAADD